MAEEPFSYVARLLGGTAGLTGDVSISSSDVDASIPIVFKLLVEYDCFLRLCSVLLLVLLWELIVGRISLDTFLSVSLSESDWFNTPLDRLRVIIVLLFFAYLDEFRAGIDGRLFADTEMSFYFLTICLSNRHGGERISDESVTRQRRVLPHILYVKMIN